MGEIEKLKSVIDEYSTRNNDLNVIVDKLRNEETVLLKDIENKQNELVNTRKNNQVLERNYKNLQLKFEQLKNEKNIKEAEYDRKFKDQYNILMLQTAKTKMLENQLDISKKNLDELT